MDKTKCELQLAGAVDVWPTGMFCCGPSIGGVDVTEAIAERWGHYATPNVRVYLGIEPRPPQVAEGALSAYGGFGGTDVTPSDPPEIVVGGVDLLDRLNDLDGREVLLIIEDAPLA